tara:strand:+ start:79 stop:1704 length:1626 start_codon:yes stop_codon:yes gene_type:complete
MAYYGKPEISTGGGSTGEKRNKYTRTDQLSGKIPTTAAARAIARAEAASTDKSAEKVFHQLEAAEVIEVITTEEQLPELTNGDPDWSFMGAIYARMIHSEFGALVGTLRPIKPLSTTFHDWPLKGEYVVVVSYVSKVGTNETYYTDKINLFNSANANILPGKSGFRPEDIVSEDGVYDYFEPEGVSYGPFKEIVEEKVVRNLWPWEGDKIIQGRMGNSIRFSSNIVPESHDDEEEAQESPNILIRTGQLLDAEDFDKSEYVEELKNTPNMPVKEDINADGSSIWLTTDQSVKLNIEKTNAEDHSYMTSLHSDDIPTNGGKQITINSDRITFNTKKGKILGFSADGIGFSTKKSFSVDADSGMKMNSGGATSMDMVPGGISLVTPGNSRLDLGQGGSGGGTDTIYLSSECPSFLTLDDKAHLQSCLGAIVHLDDCAGIKDNQGSFLRIGGEALGITGFVTGRDDMGQQHLVYGEELTNILDSICNSFQELGDTILKLAGIPTGAGPSGPISGGPTNQLAIDAWMIGVETIRARLCDMLMKPE